MKKSISLLLIMALLIAGFAYLGSVVKEKHSMSNLTVTIIVPSQAGDKAFSDSAYEGGKYLTEYGVNVSYIECKDEGYKPQMMKAAAESDMVVCVGPEFWEITDVTQEYPYTNFIWLGASVDDPQNYTNLQNVVFAGNEGSYLVGYVAAAMSHTGVIGAVLGDEDSYYNGVIAGFTQGARQANDTVEVITNHAEGNYNDFQLGRKLASELLDQGADIIYVIPGKTGEGVLMEVKAKGAQAVGLGRDAKTDNPQYDDLILCSMEEEWGSAIFNIVKNYYDYGTFDGGTVLLADTARHYIGITYGDKNSAQLLDIDLTAQISNLRQKIINREIKVDTAVQ